MKPLCLLPGIAAALLAGCFNAKTQSNPPAPVTVPPATMPSASPQASMPMMVKPVPSEFSYSSVNVDQPVVALTFDDGPSAKLTPELLDLLKERNIKVTFFVLGENVAQNPDILRRAVAEGHEIGNHTWDHKQLTRLSPEAVANELNKTSDIIFQVTGKRPTLMRPPYGAVNPAMKKRINDEFGMKVILWSVDPNDWRDPGPAVVASRILKDPLTRPGGIILSHDIHAGTVKAMPEILDGLKAKGLRIVTVSELLAMDKGPMPKPVKPAPVKGAANTTGHPKGATAGTTTPTKQ